MQDSSCVRVSRPFITETRVPYVFQPWAHIEYASCSGMLCAERAFEISRASVFSPELRPPPRAAHAESRSGSHGVQEPWKDRASMAPRGKQLLLISPHPRLYERGSAYCAGMDGKGLGDGQRLGPHWGAHPVSVESPTAIASSRMTCGGGLGLLWDPNANLVPWHLRIERERIVTSIVEMVFGKGATKGSVRKRRFQWEDHTYDVTCSGAALVDSGSHLCVGTATSSSNNLMQSARFGRSELSQTMFRSHEGKRFV
jgi:hypothetical protein